MGTVTERADHVGISKSGIIDIDALRNSLKFVYPPAPIVFIGSPPCALMWDKVSVRSINDDKTSKDTDRKD
jgi:hypothetical protein